MTRAAIVIPLHGRADLTERCLSSLDAAGDEVELVLVDNASTDGTAALLDRMAPDARVIRNPTNLGFATASNQGALAAESPVVVFLNNDTEVTRGWLDPILEELEDPTVGAVGARLLYPTGRVQHAGMAMAPGASPLHIHRGAPGDHPAVTRRRDLQMVTAACMGMRRELVVALGGFDTGYRNGFEDTDLCLRAIRMGRRVRYAGDSVVMHHESQTSGRYEHTTPNTIRFRERWRQWPADFAAVVAEDAAGPVTWADTIWVGPLFDGSDAAAAGQRAIVALAREGRRPYAVERPVRDGPDAVACPPEVLAALNRLYVPCADPLVWSGEPGVGIDAGVAVPADVAEDALTTETPDAHARQRMGLGRPRIGVRWMGPLAGRSETAAASRALVRAGRGSGLSFELISLDGTPDGDVGGPGDPARAPISPTATVVHATGRPEVASSAGTRLDGRLVVALACGDRAPSEQMRSALAIAEQVWVPGPGDLRTLTAAGIPLERLRLVPPPIDTARFTPAPEEAGRRQDRFLATSAMDWSHGSGWDLLLRAWVEEFAPGEAVTLRLVTRGGAGAVRADDVMAKVTHLLEELGRAPDAIPDIELVATEMSERERIRMLREADVFVLAAREVGGGVAVLEAMAAGTPVIATPAGDHEPLMRPELALVLGGASSEAEGGSGPAVADLRRALRALREEPLAAATRAAAARAAVHAAHGHEAVGRILVERVEELLDVGVLSP